jgi:hypothetical protein
MAHTGSDAWLDALEYWAGVEHNADIKLEPQGDGPSGPVNRLPI